MFPIILKPIHQSIFTLPVRIPDEKKKLTSVFIFALLCGAAKGFTKALDAFI